MRFNAISISTRREYDTVIIKTKEGKYTYAEPGIGPVRTGYPGEGAELNWEEGYAGWVHTHGNYWGRLNDVFSKVDYDISNYRKVPGYVGTPAGTVRRYDPSDKSDVIISYDVPIDPRHP